MSYEGNTRDINILYHPSERCNPGTLVFCRTLWDQQILPGSLSLSLSFSLFSQLLPRRVEFRVSGGERRTSPRRSSLTRCLRGFRHRPRGFVCSVNNDTGLEVGSLHKLCNVRSLDQARLCFSISFEVLGKFIPNSQQCSSTPLIAIVAVGNLINLNLIIMNNEFNK